MSQQFNIEAYDLEKIGRQGRGTVNVKVHGYWSRDSATIYIERKTEWLSTRSHLPYDQHPAVWSATMSHGSGGRETKEVESDLEAGMNFGAALIALATVGQKILSQHTLLESKYQERRAEEEFVRSAAAAELRAKMEADEALGVARSTELLARAVQEAVKSGQAVINAYHRGSLSMDPIVVTHSKMLHRTTLTYSGVLTARAAAAARLAGCSVRSVVCSDEI